MHGFVNMWVYLFMGFVVCGCVYVWIFLRFVCVCVCVCISGIL